MKNYQKNAIFPSVLVSCMTNQPIHAEYEKTHYGIYKRPNLEMHFEPLVQMDFKPIEH